MGCCMLMNSRGRTPFEGLYLDEFLRRTPFFGLYVLMDSRGGHPFGGCMLMNSRGELPILRGGPPLGTISMDLVVLEGGF